MSVCCKRCEVPLTSAPPLWVKEWPTAPLGFITLALAPEGHGCDPRNGGDRLAMANAGWFPLVPVPCRECGGPLTSTHACDERDRRAA